MAEALQRFFIRGKRSVVVAGSHGKTTTASFVAHLLDVAGLRPVFSSAASPPISPPITGWPPAIISSARATNTKPLFSTARPNSSSTGPSCCCSPPSSTTTSISTPRRKPTCRASATWSTRSRAAADHRQRRLRNGPPGGRPRVHPGHFLRRRRQPPRDHGAAPRPRRLRFHPGGRRRRPPFPHPAARPLQRLEPGGRNPARPRIRPAARGRRRGRWPLSGSGAPAVAARSGPGTRSSFRDFAHHPTAIAQVLGGLPDAYPGRKVIAVFEPRSWSLRRNFFQDRLPAALAHADEIVIKDVYEKEKIPAANAFRSTGSGPGWKPWGKKSMSSPTMKRSSPLSGPWTLAKSRWSFSCPTATCVISAIGCALCRDRVRPV